MLRLAASILVLSSLTFAVGCAEAPNAEEAGDTSDAITGGVYVGKVVTVSGDALRLRSTPDLKKADGSALTKNIVGLLPVGTKIKISDATEHNGFYAVEVLTADMRKKLATPTGWVYGEFIKQQLQEPVDNTVEDGNGTGSWNNPEPALVSYTFADCSGMKDDQGKAMAPTVEQFLANDEPYAVIALDTNTYSYNMVAEITELSAKSPVNPNGIRIPLRIVKTSKTQPSGGFTATICASPSLQADLPNKSGKVTLTVYPDPI